MSNTGSATALININIFNPLLLLSLHSSKNPVETIPSQEHLSLHRVWIWNFLLVISVVFSLKFPVSRQAYFERLWCYCNSRKRHKIHFRWIFIRPGVWYLNPFSAENCPSPSFLSRSKTYNFKFANVIKIRQCLFKMPGGAVTGDCCICLIVLCLGLKNALI